MAEKIDTANTTAVCVPPPCVELKGQKDGKIFLKLFTYHSRWFSAPSHKTCSQCENANFGRVSRFLAPLSVISEDCKRRIKIPKQDIKDIFCSFFVFDSDRKEKSLEKSETSGSAGGTFCQRNKKGSPVQASISLHSALHRSPCQYYTLVCQNTCVILCQILF